jgi:NHL repeat
MIRKTLSLVLLLFSVAAIAAPPAGVVTTIAGNPGVAGYWDGPATDAMFTHPTWLDVAVARSAAPTCDEGKSGEIFVVDRINQLVRRIDQSGNVTTVRIPHLLDFDSAFGGGVLVERPGDGCGCSIYSRGVFFASTGANQVVLAHPSGDLVSRDDWSPILGTGKAGAADGDSASVAQFNKPVGLARSKDLDEPFGSTIVKRKVYIADSGNHTIRRIDWQLSFEGCPQGKRVTTLAGAAGQPGSADGTGSAARFNTPRGVAVAPDNSIYVTDSGNHTVRRITPDGVVTTVAGVPGEPGSDERHLNTPSGIDVDANGNVYVVDTFNHAVRTIGSDGQLITVAGQLGVSGFADGDAATAKFNAPVGLKVAPDGSIVVADTGNNVIRRLTLK